MKSSILGKLCVVTLLSSLTGLAMAQAYPARPVKMMVPYGPGTAIDVVVRHVAEALGKQMGQTFLVENRAGASGTIATAAVALAPADGYTILSDASTHTSAPILLGKVPYEVIRDFAGITTLTESTLVLVVPKSTGVTSINELIAAARAKPGALSFATAGVGSSTHLTTEKFVAAAGIKALHVPFKSTTDGLTEIVSGRIEFGYTGVASAVALIRDNRLVPLVVNGSRRSAALPNVPTIAEAGLPNGNYGGWLGLMVPIKTPRDIVLRLNQEVVKAMHTPEMKEKLIKAGTDAWTMTVDEFDAMRRREAADNEKMIKDLNLKIS